MQQYMPTEADQELVLKHRADITKMVDIAAALVFDKYRQEKTIPPIPLLVEFYQQIREKTGELFAGQLNPEHMEYVVISEFTRTYASMADPKDPKNIESMMFAGADVLFADRRASRFFSLRPWAVLFERFLESQKDMEWQISVALFASWTDPTKCMFNRTEMSLIVRAHISALARRLGELDTEEGLAPIRDLISADAQVIMAAGAKQIRQPLAKAKSRLISTCHHTLSNISLYRK